MMWLAGMCVLIGLAWALAAGGLGGGNLVVGMAAAALALILSGARLGAGRDLRRVRIAAALAVVAIVDLTRSGLRGIARALRPPTETRQQVVAYASSVEGERALGLLALLATLMPGVLAVGMTADRRLLHLRLPDGEDADTVCRTVAERLERRILDLFE